MGLYADTPAADRDPCCGREECSEPESGRGGGTRSGSAPGPPVAQPAGGSTDSSLSDDSKKSRGAEYKVRLAEAETYLKQAEGYVRVAQENWDFVNGHTNSSTISLNYARSLLAAAKEEAARRRKLRDDIEDAARREGIPPGYLR